MKTWKKIFFAACVFIMQGGLASATEVSLYTESGLLSDQKKLRVRVFADITDISNGGELLCAGFVLSYGEGLTSPVAEKNSVDWYLGNPVNPLIYTDPDITGDGKIVFLLGKLDENHPAKGISGYHVLLGSVLFDYSGSNPTAGDLRLTEGHPGEFSDFVTTKGIVLDPSISYTVAGFHPADSLQLQGVIRVLELLSNIEAKDKPVRLAPDDITENGKIGIEDPIYMLKQISH
ncbi:hypothetical protein [Desulfobacter latus]|uniref:Uncharacterized protein n=1 Tax=Desulfobacter latus TaxID=2292 RepID=A0A850TAJ5_9BACT|nr:hypothetical protein [Desulfobacter latus]NWH05247.1 hypothetical protein [Desulfobacter latus]